MDELKEYFLKVVRDNYANFEGRARRKEYWLFCLVYLILYIGLMIVGGVLSMISSGLGSLFFGLAALGSLAILVPSLAVGVRRLHDVGKSGWFLLIALIPLIGSIWLLVLFATEGTPGENMYGRNPKDVTASGSRL